MPSRTEPTEKEGRGGDLHRSTARLVLVYLLVSAAYIYFSDRILAALAARGAMDHDGIARWQTGKGWVFVAATAGLVYLLVWRILARRARERAAAERKLREGEQRFRTAAECASDVIYERDVATGRLDLFGDTDGTFAFATGAPHSLAEAAERVHPEDRPRVIEAFEAARKSGERYQIEYRVRRDDGTYAEFLDRGRYVYDEAGQPRRAVGALSDLTEVRAAERQQRSLEAQLQQAMKMEAIGRLAGGVAHDFNNLLTVVVGNTRLALDALPASHAAHPLLEDVDLAARHAGDLTRRLLAFSRKQIIEPRPVQPNALVDGLRRFLSRALGEDVELRLDLDPTVGEIKADPGQLEQVLVNLAVNARDAMPRGGRLSIETRRVLLPEPGRPLPRGTEPGCHLRLTVADSGTGMSAEVQERCFEPFFTTKPAGQGTGLGLSVIYGAVAQNRGAVELASEPGRGTRVTIYWPMLEGAAEPVPVAAAPVLAVGSETVLVVEDQPLVRRLAAKTLARRGYRVLEAEDAGQALSVFESAAAPVDLLVTDLVMPGMSGAALARRLRERSPDLRVLVATARPDDLASRDAELRFLAKPYDPEMLARKVREVLDERPGSG